MDRSQCRAYHIYSARSTFSEIGVIDNDILRTNIPCIDIGAGLVLHVLWPSHFVLNKNKGQLLFNINIKLLLNHL